MENFWKELENKTGIKRKRYFAEMIIFIFCAIYVVLSFTVIPSPVTPMLSGKYAIDWWFWVFTVVLILAARCGVATAFNTAEIILFWQQNKKK
ncbi:MAG: hypothetical protein IJ545_01750 [Alphaproteobacteria bacterium]|nr:hypothetical protein [Alphaproteobacteria bacterium]